MNVSLEKIDSLISDDSLTELLTGMVDVASPTGDEAPLARHIVEQLRRFGVTAQEQELDATQANAFGVLAGTGGGKSMLLYAPIDTVTSNSASEDLPWVGPEMRDDMRAKSYVKDGHIFGLGAHNPKGHGACILEAARVLKALDCDLAGDVMFGFGAGGMPTNEREGKRVGSGHGVGCEHMLEQTKSPNSNFPNVTLPDYAIIAKSGWAISWEEVGFIWFDVYVEGVHNYVGSRHLIPYYNPIRDASKLIVALEDWFDERAEDNATPLIKPQAVTSFIESGWERMPAFTPALCRFRVDYRFGPESSLEATEQEFAAKLEALNKELGIKSTYKIVQTIPATRTDPESAVIKNSIEAWEQINGQAHQPLPFTSGATDANILRDNGVPSARVGLLKAQLPEIDFALGMNCASLKDLRNLTKLLILSTLKTCGDAR